MKIITSIFLCYLSFSLLRADLAIKSEMVMGEKDRPPMQISMKLKPGKMRSDMQTEMGPISSIMLMDEKKMIVLMAAQKMYMIRDMDALAPKADETPEALPKVERTGKKEKISGYDCEQVLFKFADGKVYELWFSPDAPDVKEFASTFQSLAGSSSSKADFAWMKFMLENRDLKTYPVRMVARSLDGKETLKSTVLEFNTSSLSADIFAPPADYTEQKIPGFGGMGGGGGGKGAGGADMEKLREMMKQGKEGKAPSAEDIEAMKEWAKKMQEQQKGE